MIKRHLYLSIYVYIYILHKYLNILSAILLRNLSIKENFHASETSGSVFSSAILVKACRSNNPSTGTH